MSSSSTALSSSTPSSTSSLAEMVGHRVKLFFPYREGNISEMERQLEKKQTVISIEASGPISPSKNWRFETAGGLRFEGVVDTGETSATILVEDAAVSCCRCCMETGVPIPPFSSRIKGMAVRFSESDPYPIEATILKVEKQRTLSDIFLEMTILPPYSASLGDRIILSSGLNTWEATVMYFGDHKRDGLTGLGNKISIHVLDEHVPRGPICLPYAKISIRPAPSGPANVAISRKSEGDSQRKRKSSAYGENEMNQQKIKVAINGYREIGKALARVALDSEHVELVAISDPSITDQVCMFRDSKCDFEVTNSGSRIILFGEKEVDFFQERDLRMVPWCVKPKLVVTSSNSSRAEEESYLKSASLYSRTPDQKLTGPLERMLGISTVKPKKSWSPILRIQAISPSDARAVSNCFPLWKGERIASVFRFQGTEVIFELGEYPKYESLPNSTQPTIDLSRIVRWCFHMLSIIPGAVCDVEISERPRRV